MREGRKRGAEKERKRFFWWRREESGEEREREELTGKCIGWGKEGDFFYREGERGNWRRRLRSGANYRGPLERYVRNKVEMGWDAAEVGVGGARRGWGGEKDTKCHSDPLFPPLVFSLQ